MMPIPNLGGACCPMTKQRAECLCRDNRSPKSGPALSPAPKLSKGDSEMPGDEGLDPGPPDSAGNPGEAQPAKSAREKNRQVWGCSHSCCLLACLLACSLVHTSEPLGVTEYLG